MGAGRKVPPYDIVGMDNQDASFYDTLGPFLSRRDIVEELGSPVWDDDDKTWLIAIGKETGDVLGFVSYLPTGTGWGVRSLYVLPEVRGDVIGSTLVIRLLDRIPNEPVTATATPMSVNVFDECGFKETGTKGRFTLMELDRG